MKCKDNGLTVLADAGGTKIDWLAMDAATGRVAGRVETPGVSPLRDDAVAMSGMFRRAYEALGAECPREINYYGSGCIGGGISRRVAEALRTAFSADGADTEIKVESDMLGAARALCGRREGVVCILGTGSNSCVYNGKTIVDNTPPLGYVLGDEGSAAWLGRELLSGVLKGWLPESVRKHFNEDYPGLTKTEVISRVYSADAPNAFLGSLSRFYSRHATEESLRHTVSRGFGLFLDRNVMRYGDVERMPVNFTGSVACGFAALMRAELERRGLDCGLFVARPIDGLVAFHMSK